uniref:sodium-dependent phosphate transporter 2 n=1 Tax=Ciona intestinalis TaxID=7719 RepID=UPI000180D433|nr:sodium-dependent phosphate transporter 2 [Ciona intestinalis]|eukprot:XP_002131597.1 sodium-dependent phosphate transporter 2 [Ciona intestinalis]
MSTAALTDAISTVTSAITSATTGFSTEQFQSDVLWMIIVGFIIAFVLAFAVGANDVANSFGTTVGSGTLTLKQACILASIFETLGAILLGAKVGATIRKKIIDVNIYSGQQALLMAGNISAMLASGLWQLIATFLKLPVSGTHSIVGAIVGFSLVAHGADGVSWVMMGKIVASWFLSPLLAGGMAAAFYVLLRVLIFQKDDPVYPGLIAMPVLYGCTIGINCFSVFFSGAPLLGFNYLSVGADIGIAIGISVVVALVVQFVVVKKMRASIERSRSEIVNQAAVSDPDNQQLSAVGSKKHVKLPTVMETISEKESPESSNAKLAENCKKVNANCSKITDEKMPRTNGDGHCHKRTRNSSTRDYFTPKTVEEAKMLRQASSKRSKSTGHDIHHSSVRLPPLLQMEKQVLKTSVALPSVKQIKDEIRRNFSEPAMITITEKSDADVYEVFINRQRNLVTIQRKNEHLPSYSSVDAKGDGSHELENLLSAYPQDMKFEECFEESDDEGLAMKPTAQLQEKHGLPNKYSGAIMEGFRRLSSSQQNIVAIRVGDDVEEKEHEELTKEEELEAKEGRIEVRKIFSFLQILTACFGAFAHGGNDVSNAIGPLIALWIIYSDGSVQQTSGTPLLILLYGGFGICCGLWIWGRRVIKTMGQDLTNLTPSRGFAIELMSAITVLVASNLSLPVSTTHCKVGAVVAVGWVRGREAVDWKIFRNIIFAWFVTLPISGGLSALTFGLIRAITKL